MKHGFLTLGAGKTFHPGLPVSKSRVFVAVLTFSQPNYDGNRSWTDPTK